MQYSSYEFINIDFIHSTFDGEHLGCFHSLMVLNRVAVNVVIHFFCHTYVLFSFGCIARLHMIGSFVRLTISFSNMLNTIFQVVVPVYQQCMRVLVVSHSHWSLVLSVFLNFAVLADTQCYFYGSCSLITTEINTFSYACWPFGYPFLWYDYSSLLSIIFIEMFVFFS